MSIKLFTKQDLTRSHVFAYTRTLGHDLCFLRLSSMHGPKLKIKKCNPLEHGGEMGSPLNGTQRDEDERRREVKHGENQFDSCKRAMSPEAIQFHECQGGCLLLYSRPMD
jgi:hypothetical protein